TPYVKERQAFGEPIAHRQAVAFMVADIATELDGLRLVTWRGAARAEQGMTFAREAALARKLAADKGMKIGLDGVQLLGGHGFTKDHPVERWYRDLRAVGVAEGVVVLRSEAHTSELQSRFDLVCRLLLAKKKTAHALFPCSRSVHHTR